MDWGREVGQLNQKTWVKPYASSAARTGLEGEMETSMAMADCKSHLMCRTLSGAGKVILPYA